MSSSESKDYSDSDQFLYEEEKDLSMSEEEEYLSESNEEKGHVITSKEVQNEYKKNLNNIIDKNPDQSYNSYVNEFFSTNKQKRHHTTPQNNLRYAPETLRLRHRYAPESFRLWDNKRFIEMEHSRRQSRKQSPIRDIPNKAVMFQNESNSQLNMRKKQYNALSKKELTQICKGRKIRIHP